MLKGKDNIDLKWLAQKFQLRYARHCDEPGMYLFYSDTFYIDTLRSTEEENSVR